MTPNLKVTTIQSSLHWENIDQNLLMFEQKINALKESTDLIILPEMFSTGFSMKPASLAESMNGKTMNWMTQQAAKSKAVIMGSFICKEKGQYFNRLIWMKSDGTYSIYDKRHLFTLANEHEHYKAGYTKLIVELKGWKICPLICYDLRFPVWSRNVESYDLLIYVANWPSKRANAWKSLLLARAIENQSYTIGVNRLGTDANDLNYSGDTSIINYAGDILYQKTKEEEVYTTILNYKALHQFRSKLSFLNDQDQFQILSN